MKKPWLAALLSFLIVGAGLAYLGKWKWAAINCFSVIAVALVLNRYSPDSLSWLAPGLGAGSASIALQAAKAMNQKTPLQADSQQHCSQRDPEWDAVVFPGQMTRRRLHGPWHRSERLTADLAQCYTARHGCLGSYRLAVASRAWYRSSRFSIALFKLNFLSPGWNIAIALLLTAGLFILTGLLVETNRNSHMMRRRLHRTWRVRRYLPRRKEGQS